MSSIFKVKLSVFFSLLFLTGLFGLGASSAYCEESFKPYMVDHENIGCPANSDCDHETGKLYKKWVDLHKNPKKGNQDFAQFLAQHGHPFKVWHLKDKPIKGLISWDSPCEHHRPKEEKEQSIDQAQYFLKELTPEKFPAFLFDSAYVSDGKSAQSPIYKFLIPRGSVPYTLDKEELVFFEEEEGQYYYLKIKANGKLSIDLTRPNKKPESTEVECPTYMLQHLAKNPPEKMIYQSFYCKRISSASSSQELIALLPMACE